MVVQKLGKIRNKEVIGKLSFQCTWVTAKMFLCVCVSHKALKMDIRDNED